MFVKKVIRVKDVMTQQPELMPVPVSVSSSLSATCQPEDSESEPEGAPNTSPRDFLEQPLYTAHLNYLCYA